MAARDIRTIARMENHVGLEKKDQPVPVIEASIQIHYPKPIFVSEVLLDVAAWSDYNFVMDPALNRQLQIFAPRKLPKEEAFHLFVKSLETIGLRVLNQ
mgnify:CR=1 FL=1